METKVLGKIYQELIDALNKNEFNIIYKTEYDILEGGQIILDNGTFLISLYDKNYNEEITIGRVTLDADDPLVLRGEFINVDNIIKYLKEWNNFPKLCIRCKKLYDILNENKKCFKCVRTEEEIRPFEELFD